MPLAPAIVTQLSPPPVDARDEYRIQVRAFRGLDFGPGDLVAEFGHPKNIAWGKYVNDVPELFFTVDMDDPQLRVLRGYVNKAHVWVWRGNRLVWTGFFGLEVDANSRDVVFYCFGYEAALFWTVTGWQEEWSGASLNLVAGDIWRRAQSLSKSNLAFVGTGIVELPPTTSELPPLHPDSDIVATKSVSNPTLNEQGAMPENVIKVGSTYWLNYTRRIGSNVDVRLASATSIEGPWTPYGGNPVLTLGSQAWENGVTGSNGSCILEDAGTFYIFYASEAGAGTPGVGYATAPAVTGPYTKYASNPVIVPGGAGQWDERRLQEPSVIKVGSTWVMAYMAEEMAVPQSQSEKIGMATASSPSGPWTKSALNPVIGFGPAGTFDDAGAADPSMFYEDGRYWMWYSGLAGPVGGKPWTLGLAYATDPVGPYVRHASNPLIDVGGVGELDSQAVWRGAIFRDVDAYHVVFGAIGDTGSSADAKGHNAVLQLSAAEQQTLPGLELPFYQVFHKRALFAMQELAALAASDTTNQTIFEITHERSPLFNFFRNRGSEATDLRLEWGGKYIQDFHYLHSPVFLRNALYSVGADPWSSVLRRTDTDATSMNAIGRREEPIYLAWVRDNAELERVAKKRMSRALGAGTVLSLSLFPNTLSPPGADGERFRVGDRIPVKIDHGIVDIDESQVVVGVQVAVLQDGVERVRLLMQERQGQ